MGAIDIRGTEKSAIQYLAEQLGPRAPQYLVLEGEFDEIPLDGEGRTALFSFSLAPGSGVAAGDCATKYEPKHYVAVGETTPNYFPAFGLSSDDAYSFHIGTRFMLEMELQRMEDSFEPPGARARMRALVREFAPTADVEREELVALFKCDADYYAVYRLSVGGQDIYFLGADCPPGFYQLTRYPPQTVLRLHLGKLIRAEARQMNEVPR